MISPRLTDIIDAITRIRRVTSDISLEVFERDIDRRWLVERGVEIISEASRHPTDDLKARQPSIPWSKVAGIGNVIRHTHDRVAPDIFWKLVQDELPPLEVVCREELALALVRESEP